jgi:hypothetical protein
MLVLSDSTADCLFKDVIDILWLRLKQCFHYRPLKYMVVPQIAPGGRKRRLRAEPSFILAQSFGFRIFPERYTQTLAAMLWQEAPIFLQQYLGEDHSTAPALLSRPMSFKYHHDRAAFEVFMQKFIYPYERLLEDSEHPPALSLAPLDGENRIRRNDAILGQDYSRTKPTQGEKSDDLFELLDRGDAGRAEAVSPFPPRADSLRRYQAFDLDD